MTRFVKAALAAALSLACLPASAQVIAPQQRVPTSDPNIDQICDVLPGTATPVCSRQLDKAAGLIKILPSALPNPTITTPGGAYAAQAGAHQFGTGISIFGLPTFAQPAASDVSGLAASATTDTTNASNIASGLLPAARLTGIAALLSNNLSDMPNAATALSNLGGAPLSNPNFLGSIGVGGAANVSYTSSGVGSILYGYTAIVNGAGSGTDLIVGAQLGAHAMGTGTRQIWGVATEAWAGAAGTAPTTSQTLIGAELAVISQFDGNTQPIVGADLPFKDRADNVTAVLRGLGSNGYNLNSRAVQISAQPRSTAGEYSGWSTGILFQAGALDRTTASLAVGIDMSALDYSRMASAVRMPTGGMLTWDAADARKVGVLSGSLVYSVSGANVFSVDSSGNMILAGTPQFGAYTAGSASPTGYLTVKDNTGTVRHLATVP